MADTSFDTHPALLGADTLNAEAQSTGITLSDFVTKGVPAAVTSGLMSIVNTGLSYMGQNEIPTEQALRNIDSSWADYYTQHKDSSDLLGFFGGSVAVGGIATKALRWLGEGEAIGPISRALGFAENQNKSMMAKAIEELGSPGGSMSTNIAATKWARLGWATASNLLTSTAVEGAIIGTMKESPLLDGYSTKDFVMFSLLGGGLGGGAEYLAGRGILKRGAETVERQSRQFDTLLDPTNMGLAPSDEALHLADSMVKLSKNYTKTPFSYTYAGETRAVEIPTEKLFEQLRASAMKSGFDRLALKMNTLAGDNVNVGQAFFGKLMGIVKDADASGDVKGLTDTLAGILGPVRSISPVTSEVRVADDATKLFYVNQKASSLMEAFSPKFSADSTFKTPYKMAEGIDATQLKSARLDDIGATSVKEAFNQGHDVVIDSKGRVRINPNSDKIIKGVSGVDAKASIYDLESGSISNSHVPTAGDLIGNYSKDVRLTRKGVLIGKDEFEQPLQPVARPGCRGCGFALRGPAAAARRRGMDRAAHRQ